MNRSGAGVKLEQYMTPDEVSRAAVKYLLRENIINQHVPVYEPCAGRGSFVRALEQQQISVVANDIDPEFGWEGTRDAAEAWPELGQELVNVVTNPPFSRAMEILVQAHEALPLGSRIVFLLSMSFYSGKERLKLLSEKYSPRRVVVLHPRTNYLYIQSDGSLDYITPKGNPSRANGPSALYIWEVGFSGNRVLDYLDINEI